MSGVVVVTGSASGLGRTYCRELAAAGWTVVGADLHETEDVALSVVTDVSDRLQTERLAVAAHERFGRIDGLVNNAAYYTAIVKRPFEEIDDEEWSRVFDVNVRGAWLCARAVAPFMRQQGSGKIVNVSSMTVPTAPPGFAHYVASKAAIHGFLRSLAKEVASRGITANAVAAGFVRTDLSRAVLQTRPGIVEAIPMKRIAEPDEVTSLVAFLASDAARYVTGEVLGATGGMCQ